MPRALDAANRADATSATLACNFASHLNRAKGSDTARYSLVLTHSLGEWIVLPVLGDSESV